MISAEFLGGCADGAQNSIICASTGEQCEIANWSQGRGNSVAMKVIFQTDRSFAAAMNRVTTVQFFIVFSISVKYKNTKALYHSYDSKGTVYLKNLI